MEKESILDEAKRIREGSRHSDYGDAVENFKNISQMASIMLGKHLTPEDCVAILMAVKLCRERYHHKRDNLVDLCGYADIMEEIKESQKDALEKRCEISDEENDKLMAGQTGIHIPMRKV